MLHHNGHKLAGGEDCVSFHNDFKMEKMCSACQDGNGFVACDCGNCMHYVWCYHACSFATKNGITLFSLKTLVEEMTTLETVQSVVHKTVQEVDGVMQSE